jgi:MFS family permease
VARAALRRALGERSVVAVVAIAFVTMLGLGMALPTLPLYARSFDVGYGAAGLLIAAYGLTRLGVDLAAGVLVDRVGERAAGVLGLAGTAGCALLTGLAPSFAVAVAGWGLVGAFSAISQAANYTHLLRTVPRDRIARAVGIFYGAFNVGLAAGGFAGGFLAEHIGLASPLYGTAVLTGLGAILYAALVPGAQRRVRAGQVAQLPARTRLADLVRLPGLTATLAGQLASLWVFAAVFSTLVPLFGREELGMSPAAIGIVLAIGLAVELVFLYPAGSAADRRGRRRVLVPALVALGATTVAIGWAGSPAGFGGLVALASIASAFVAVVPSAMLSDVVGTERTGTAVGVFRFAGDLGFALGPLTAGLVAQAAGLRAGFAMAAAPVAIALVLVVRAAETLRGPAR